jgi:uncharacterized Zn finger protein
LSWYEWRAYVPVAERRRQAEREVAALKKRGKTVSPVRITGREIARSFWGKSWCLNLERYSDYETRLPRGRTYLRNGSVVDLQVAKGELTALVAGSELYEISITIAPLAAPRWKAICRDCAGSVDSLVELLQGRLAQGVMDRVCREGDGLFPSPAEIKLSCSCLDWAEMCKHVAAVLYGVGARLDAEPALLFLLRGVDQNDLIAASHADLTLAQKAPEAANRLDDSDVAALFGIEMAGAVDRPGAPAAPKAKPARKAKAKPARKVKAKPARKKRPKASAARKPAPQRSRRA